MTEIVQNHKKLLTRSAGGKDIWVHHVGDLKLPRFVLMGGIHGDEPEGALIVEDFLAHAQQLKNALKASALVVPRYNPDGLDINERVNSRGVDLNRNFPATDWSPEHKAPRYFPGTHANSEPETQGFVELLQQHQPFLVVHCHTYIPQINYTGTQSKKWAEIIGLGSGHPITEDIGYPTPGSLGQFCLHNLKTACVCIELPEQVERKSAWAMVGPNLLTILERGLDLIK